MDLPEAVQVMVCNQLPLHTLARLATVSKLWAETYKARLSRLQQLLKDFVAIARCGPPSAAPLAALPTHFPPSPTPPTPGQGRWGPLFPAIPGIMDTWHQDGWRELDFSVGRGFHIRRNGCRFGNCQGFRVHCITNDESGQCEHIDVDAAVVEPKDRYRLMGLLLMLLEDVLPRLLQEQWQQSGGPASALNVDVGCTLAFGSSFGFWAPLAPVVRELQFDQIVLDENDGSGGQAEEEEELMDDDDDSDADLRMRNARKPHIVFSKAVVSESGGSQPCLDVVLTVSAPSWDS